MIRAVHSRSPFHLVATLAGMLAVGAGLSCADEESHPDDVVSLASQPLTLGAVNVLTRNYGNLRTGANLSETVLNPSNVNTSSFGKIFQVAVDDQVYAGILYASAVPIAGRTRNVFYVATVNNTVYAFDADVGGAPLWKKNFNGTARPSRNSETPCGPTGNFNFLSNIGIVGTPVIDGNSGTMYFVTRTVEGTSTVQRMRAIDITTGLDRSNSPKVISMTVPGTGVGSVGGNIAFDPFVQNQRPALALSQGVVYVAWASYCDKGDYHGWTAGFDAATLTLTGASNDTPSGAMAGIWMGGAGPVADASGFVYVTTGNGDWNGTSNFGESLLKLSPTTLARSSFFTPSNVAALNAADDDLNASGPMMLPIAGNLMVTGSKEGKIYMLSSGASNIGGMVNGDTQIPQVFQAVVPSIRPSNTHHIHSSPVAWQSPQGLNLYVWGENDFLRMYRFNTATQKFTTTPAATGSILPPIGMPGGMLAVSANGSTAGTGVVWATVPKSGDASGSTVPGTLRAFNAETLALLWNSTTNASGDDDTFDLAKFNVPTVASGKVYVPSFSSSVSVYGVRTEIPFNGLAAAVPGTIEAENFDFGGEGTAYHDSETANQGGAYRTSGVDIETASEGGFDVGWLAAGEWLKYSVNVATAGTYNLSARVSSPGGGGGFRVEVDGTDITGTIAVASTGGFATWATVKKDGISLPAGSHVLRVFVVTAGFNLNSLTFQSTSSCVSETDAAFCVRLAKNCGTVSANDNCNTARTVTSCGVCTAPESCGGGGTANVCGAGSVPSPPTNLAATAGDGRVMLSWTASAGATGYSVKRSTASGGPFTVIGSPSTTRFTDTTATNGTTFFFVVTASNASGPSASSTQVSATPGTSTCRSAVGGGAFVNTAISSSQAASFVAEYDATPSVANIDASIALSRGAQSAYTGYATITRFNPTGTIDARNAAGYAANASISYTAGSTYHFRLSINVAARTYSIFVTPPSGSEVALGTNFAFRSEQSAVTSLDNWGMKVSTAPTTSTETACNFWVHP